MIWAAVAIGLCLTVILLSLCYISGDSERRQEKRRDAYLQAAGRYRHDYGYSEHERFADLLEKWSDPPEFDDE